MGTPDGRKGAAKREVYDIQVNAALRESATVGDRLAHRRQHRGIDSREAASQPC